MALISKVCNAAPRRPVLALATAFILFSGACRDNPDNAAPVATVGAEQLGKYFPDSNPPPAETGSAAAPAASAAEDPVTFVEVLLPSPSFVVGTTQNARATAVTQGGRKFSVSTLAAWQSDNPSVATFGAESDALSAVAEGKANVSATYKDVVGSASVEVTRAEITRIEITPLTLNLGVKQAFRATLVLSNNTTQDVTDQVVWGTAAPLLAEQVTPGKSQFVGRGVGTAVLKAQYGAQSSSAPIKVSLLELTALTIVTDTPTLQTGTTAQLRAIGTYKSGATDDVTAAAAWSSADPSVIAVSDELGKKGLATAGAGGATTIKATIGKLDATVSLDVASNSFSSLTIEGTGILPKGLSRPLKALGVFPDGHTQDVTADVIWDSSKPFNATVSNDAEGAGVIMGVEIGDTVVTATYGELSAQAVVQISEAALQSIDVSLSKDQVDCGIETVQAKAQGFMTDGQSIDISDKVTWSVEFEDLASISNAFDSRGIVTTIKQGTTKVIARRVDAITNELITGLKALSIGAPTLTGYLVQGSKSSVPVGTKVSYRAFGVYGCPAPQIEFTASVTWSSTNPHAPISNLAASKGLVTTSGIVVADEEATISADTDGLHGDTKLTIRPKEIVSVTVEADDERVDVGETLQMKAKAVYSDGTSADVTNGGGGSTIAWTTTNAALATAAAGGVVTGVSEGFITVNADVTTPQNRIVNGSLDIGVQSHCLTGRRQNLYCWFLGQLNENCLDVCAAVSGSYVDATITYVGSGGQGARCNQVQTALNLGGLSRDELAGPNGAAVGCSVLSAVGVQVTRRYTSPATTATASHPSVRRICACGQ